METDKVQYTDSIINLTVFLIGTFHLQNSINKYARRAHQGGTFAKGALPGWNADHFFREYTVFSF